MNTRKDLYDRIVSQITVELAPRATLDAKSWEEIALIAHGIACAVLLHYPEKLLCSTSS